MDRFPQHGEKNEHLGFQVRHKSWINTAVAVGFESVGYGVVTYHCAVYVLKQLGFDASQDSLLPMVAAWLSTVYGGGRLKDTLKNRT